MLKKTILYLLMAAAAAGAALFLAGYYIPVRLEVEVDAGKLYKYEDITRDDVTVYLSPLFRRGGQVTDFRFEKTSDGEYDNITVQETIFYKTERIRNVLIDRIEAVYTGSPSEGEAFDPEKISVSVVYKDGSRREITDYELIGQADTLDLSTDLVVKTDLGSAPLDIPFRKAVRLSASYDGAHEGDKFDRGRVSVSVVYEDGSETAVPSFDTEGEDVIRGKTEYTVYTSYGPCTLTVDPVPVEYAFSDTAYMEGTPFHGTILLEYADGSEKQLTVDDVEMEETVLERGVNAIPFKWMGIDYVLYAMADTVTPVSEATATLAGEIASSVYNSVNRHMFMTVRKGGTEESPVYISHIVLWDPTQIAVESANGKYAGGLESVESAGRRTGWLLGINGSFYDIVSGIPVNAPCMIRGGQMVLDGNATGNEICLTSKGELFTPSVGVSAYELAESGVKDILISTDPLLIQNGELLSEGSTTAGGAWPRTAVGMVKPGEYYFLTASSMTLFDVQSTMSALGCKYARTLEGGAGTALAYRDYPIVTGRPSADFLYIRE